MGWQTLKDIADDNRKIAEGEANRPITKCPNCDYNELKENSRKDLICPICGWTGRR